jgi:hypothetical protein
MEPNYWTMDFYPTTAPRVKQNISTPYVSKGRTKKQQKARKTAKQNKRGK